MAFTLVNAQSDTINNSSSNAPLQSSGQQPNQYRKSDRVVIKSADMPASLKQTLRDNDAYRGWEKSTLYQDKNTNVYFFDLPNGETPKTYYFDQNGKAITGATRTSPSYNSSGDPNKP